jgi:hypothetical protein
MNLIDQDELLSVAVHEAGHSVVAANLGWDVVSLWTDGLSGECSVCPTRSGMEPSYTAVCVGGVCAEEIYYRDNTATDPLWHLEDRIDFLHACDSREQARDQYQEEDGDALEVALHLWHESRDAMRSHLRFSIDRATEILSAHWEDVEAIASCLIPAQVIV